MFAGERRRLTSQVFMAWIIAPVLAGIFASTIFLITKYAVLLRSNPVMKGIFLVPVYFALTAMLITMLLVWKGGSYEVALTEGQIPVVIILVGLGWGVLVAIFFVPWLYRTIVKEDWQLRWYDIAKGPLLLRRGDVPPPPRSYRGRVRDYYEGHATREDIEARRGTDGDADSIDKEGDDAPPERKKLVGPKPEGPWHSRDVLWWYVKWAVLHGVDQDVVGDQSKESTLAGNVDDMHARAAHYDNRAEYLYSFLQIMTACTASFTHGANDVSK